MEETATDTEIMEPEDEDDLTGFFLEPTANSVDMVERIAEANRKLYEDYDSSRYAIGRPKKVQFSERVINFETDNYESDDFISSDGNTSEDDEENVDDESKKGMTSEDTVRQMKRSQRPKTASKDTKQKLPESIPEVAEEISEEIKTEEEDQQEVKVLLVKLPRERSSSCESVIGEEIPKEKPVEKPEPEKVVAEAKPVKPTPTPCKVSKVTPDLKCSPKPEVKRREKKQMLKSKKQREGEANRPRSSIAGKKETEEAVCADRPNTAPEKRTCCVARTGLPKYNGLRSEYGLSAEQLQERRRKTFELRQQKRTDRLKKKQDEARKRILNEENFSQWLYSKRRGATIKRPVQVDTLSRSDVYIQTHAVYASRRGVSYAVNYSLQRKKRPKGERILILEAKNEKAINLEKLLDNVSPHAEHTYRIYLTSRK